MTFFEFGAPGEIRTPDQLVRSQLLYPAELRAHSVVQYLTRNRLDNRTGANLTEWRF